MAGGGGGLQLTVLSYIKVICQLSVKFWALCGHLTVVSKLDVNNSLLTLNIRLSPFLTSCNN